MSLPTSYPCSQASQPVVSSTVVSETSYCSSLFSYNSLFFWKCDDVQLFAHEIIYIILNVTHLRLFFFPNLVFCLSEACSSCILHAQVLQFVHITPQVLQFVYITRTSSAVRAYYTHKSCSSCILHAQVLLLTANTTRFR